MGCIAEHQIPFTLALADYLALKRPRAVCRIRLRVVSSGIESPSVVCCDGYRRTPGRSTVRHLETVDGPSWWVQSGLGIQAGIGRAWGYGRRSKEYAALGLLCQKAKRGTMASWQ